MTCIFYMVMQVINRIVGSTYTLHIVVFHQTSSRKLRLFQFFITLVINLTSRLRTQQLIYAKSRLQFQMCPVIQGVTKTVRHRLRPFLKLLPICGILARAVLLSTPLVRMARHL